MNDTKTKVVHVTSEQMTKLLDERCPAMSDATRSAVMQGAKLELTDGITYQIPDAKRDGKPTHHTTPTPIHRKEDPWN